MEENVEKIPCILELTENTPLDIEDLLEKPLDEGINVRYEKDKDKTIHPKVSFTDNHEYGTNTSLKENPSVSSIKLDNIENVGNIKVYSILRRTPMKVKFGSSDGNPLVYAMKNEKGYEFESDVNKDKLSKRINEILRKFLGMYFNSVKGEVVTILCPSRNQLNGSFANWVEDVSLSMNKNIRVYKDIFTRISTDEIREEVIEDPRSEFNSWLFDMSDEEAESKKEMLERYLSRMDKERNRFFSYHYVEDMEMRKRISKTMSKVDSSFGDINGANVLLLDDTISMGKTLKESCKLLCSSYTPKTVTCLTLFSELKKTV